MHIGHIESENVIITGARVILGRPFQGCDIIFPREKRKEKISMELVRNDGTSMKITCMRLK